MVLNNFYLPATRGCHARDYFEFIRRFATLPSILLSLEEIILVIFSSKFGYKLGILLRWILLSRKENAHRVVGQKVVLGAILIPFT